MLGASRLPIAGSADGNGEEFDIMSQRLASSSRQGEECRESIGVKQRVGRIMRCKVVAGNDRRASRRTQARMVCLAYRIAPFHFEEYKAHAHFD